ncbi:MAG: response regulator [Elusimicrobia bacterium]|nr:response regulator [Elusimicrobiota bacterium]
MPVANPQQLKRPRILLIDDDQGVHEVVQSLFMGSDYDLLFSSDPWEGVEMAIEHGPSLIILDIYMKGMNGYDVLAKLRYTPVTRKIPILMLTAAGSVKNIDMAFDLGADNYMIKPIEPNRLRQKVKDLLAFAG